MKPTVHPDFSCFLLDRDCEVFEVLHPYADQVFDDFQTLIVPDNALVVIGRVQTLFYYKKLRELVHSSRASFIFCNASEGSTTIRWHMDAMHIGDLVRTKQLPVITGGDLPSCYSNLTFYDFLLRILTFKANLCAESYFDKIFETKNKPFKFLFFNGRARPHRKYLLERLNRVGLLDQSLWSCLEGAGITNADIKFVDNNQDCLPVPRPTKFLPVEYEIRQHKSRVGQAPPDGNSFAKYHLFAGEWSDGELIPQAYWHSYFSIVTETIFEDHESFLTEKTWKPLLIGHPWIMVANAGVYKTLHNLGFKSFHPYIDESFDRIDNAQARIDRIGQVIIDLCSQDLEKFLEAVRPICKYNQERMLELGRNCVVNFPIEFFNFAKSNKRN